LNWYLPFHVPIKAGVGANWDRHGEKSACMAPDKKPYTMLHTIIPALLRAPIQPNAVTAQPNATAMRELKKPMRSLIGPKTLQPKNAAAFKIAG